MRLIDIHETIDITLKIESRGFHHGQSELSVVASHNQDIAEKIDYAVYEEEPSIQMINVADAYKRQGIAKKMLLFLQSEYPNTEIDWGSLTQDGSKLYNNMKWNKIPGPGYKLYTERNKWEKQKQQLGKIVEPILQNNEPMTSLPKGVQQQINDYFELSYSIEDADDELQLPSMQVYQKIMIG